MVHEHPYLTGFNTIDATSQQPIRLLSFEMKGRARRHSAAMAQKPPAPKWP
jgi:hypothetical protein